MEDVREDYNLVVQELEGRKEEECGLENNEDDEATDYPEVFQQGTGVRGLPYVKSAQKKGEEMHKISNLGKHSIVFADRESGCKQIPTFYGSQSICSHLSERISTIYTDLIDNRPKITMERLIGALIYLLYK